MSVKEQLSIREKIRAIQENPLLQERLQASPEAQRYYEELLATLDHNPLATWEPATSPRDGRRRQEEYLEAREPFKLYAGGNGAGKSDVGTVDDLIQLCDADALPAHLRRFKRWEPPVPMRVVVPKMALIDTPTLEKFRAYAPRDQLLGGSVGKAYDKQIRRLRFKNGSYVLFNTGDQDRDAHSAVELRRVRFDEEPEGEHGRGLFTENVARLRKFQPDAQVCFTMTPLFGLSWVYDTIWERREDPDVFCVVASMLDNPYINAEATIRALGHLSEEERQAVIEGLFIHVSGTVLTVRDEHVVDPIVPGHLEGQDVLVGIDPGVRRGGVVWNCFDRDNEQLVFDELYPENLTVPEIAARVMVKNAQWGLGDARERQTASAYFKDRYMAERLSTPEYETVMEALEAPPGARVLYIIDPASRQREQVNLENVQGEFERAGIWALPGQTDRRTGVLQLRARLEHGALRVTRNCVNWRQEARRWLVASDEVIAEGKATVKGAGGTFATIGPDHLMDPTRLVAMERLWYRAASAQERHRQWSPASGVAPPKSLVLSDPRRDYGPLGSCA